MQSNGTGFTPEQIRRYNSETMRLLSLYLNLASDAITPALMQEMTAACRGDERRAYATLLAILCGLAPDEGDRAYFEAYFLPMVTRCDPAVFAADRYYQSIRIPEKKRGSWELRKQTLAPYEAFVCNDPQVLSDGRMIPSIGYFDTAFPYPAVLEGGREWMTLMPNETVTTAPAIAAAHGRVVTFGLGLGYFTFHAAEKPEVESVTAVELSEDAATLFRTEILPQFSHPEKVKVVVEDAFRFADTRLGEGYDFVFADIWHDAGDGCELYRRMKRYEEKYPQIEFYYWLEQTLRCYENKNLW